MRIRIATVFSFSYLFIVAMLLWRFDYMQVVQWRSQADQNHRLQAPLLTEQFQKKLQDLSEAKTNSIATLSWSSSGANSDSDIQWGASLNPQTQNELKLQMELFRTSLNSLKSYKLGLYALGSSVPAKYIALVRKDTKGTSLSVYDPSVFESFLPENNDSNFNIIFTNQLGQILYHSHRDYIGASIEESPLFSKWIQQLKQSGQEQGREFSGQNLISFETLKSSNLGLILDSRWPSPKERWFGDLLWLASAAVGIWLMSLALLLKIMSAPISSAPQKTSQLPINTTSTDELSPEATPHFQERSVVRVTSTTNSSLESIPWFEKLASALGQEMRSPILSVLTHLEILNSKDVLQDPPIKQHLQVMSQSAYELKTLAEKLSAFCGEDQFIYQPLSIHHILTKVIRSFETKLQIKGIKLIKNLQPVSDRLISPELMQKALEAILQNSIEAMDRMPLKELQISLMESGDLIEVLIKDSGEGIENKDMDRVFDPFFTTKSPLQHSGLGLTFALGVVRNHNGKVEISSDKTNGTSVRIRFKGFAAEQLANLKKVQEQWTHNLSQHKMEPQISPLASEHEIPVLTQPTPRPEPILPLRDIESELNDIESELEVSATATTSSPQNSNRLSTTEKISNDTRKTLPRKSISKISQIHIDIKRPGIPSANIANLNSPLDRKIPEVSSAKDKT